jgi:hypothetical protein
MNIAEAQRDMRRAYLCGGPGVITSGLVWCAAAWAQHNHSAAFAFTVLFFGGMFIYPVSTLVSRALFQRESEGLGNPLGMTALESTVAMIGGLLAAWLFLSFRPALVFPVAAIAVGTHYAVFKTVYGDRSFWALGAVITIIGLMGVFALLTSDVPLLVAIMELAFGTLLTLRGLKNDPVRGL